MAETQCLSCGAMVHKKANCAHKDGVCSNCGERQKESVHLTSEDMLAGGPREVAAGGAKYKRFEATCWCVGCIMTKRKETLLNTWDVEDPSIHVAQHAWTTHDGIKKDLSSLRSWGVMWRHRGEGSVHRDARLGSEQYHRDEKNKRNHIITTTKHPSRHQNPLPNHVNIGRRTSRGGCNDVGL